VEKCRLAANYPNRGMPVMILGPSGVGKSLMAEYIFRYAKFKKLIPEDAPFVVLNCADYRFLLLRRERSRSGFRLSADCFTRRHRQWAAVFWSAVMW